MAEFSIVKTIENGKVFITTVPENWIDGETLYFPSGQDWKMLRRDKVDPELDWNTFKCSIKRVGYSKLEKALQAEKQLAEFEDTADEETYYSRKAVKRKHPGNKDSALSSMVDYNYRFNGNPKEQNVANATPEKHIVYEETEINSGYSSTHLQLLLDANRNEEDETLHNVQYQILPQIPDDIVANSNSSTQVPLQISTINYISNEEFQQEMKLLREEHNKEMAKFNVKIDKVVELLENQHRFQPLEVSAISINEETPEEIPLPVKNVQQLEEFETSLSDEIKKKLYLKRYVQEFENIGRSGRHIICYSLVEKLIDRSVLKNYTWTGVSKDHMKKNFSKLLNFNQLFFSIVKKCDKTFTEIEHENFFKNGVLKYSEVRAKPTTTAKRSSAPRTVVRKKSKSILTTVEGDDENTSPNVNTS